MSKLNFVKKNRQVIKPTLIKVGEIVVTGTYTGTREREFEERNEQGKKTGEIGTVTDLLFNEHETNNLVAVPMDAGMKVAFKDAGVKENDLIQIEKMEPVALAGGQRCNQYGISIAE